MHALILTTLPGLRGDLNDCRNKVLHCECNSIATLPQLYWMHMHSTSQMVALLQSTWRPGGHFFLNCTQSVQKHCGSSPSTPMQISFARYLPSKADIFR